MMQGTTIGLIKGDTRSLNYSSYGRLYKDYIGVIMGLYRGSNFKILPGV